MNNISKVSQITAQDVAEYLRIVEPTDEINTLNTLLTVAKEYVSQYTGRTIEELDDHSDFVIVVLILCQDMYDNRTNYVDSDNVNKVVESIMNLHSVNLL
jgi:hypothetical protein